jgi:Na+/H+ antiporter NhaC
MSYHDDEYNAYRTSEDMVGRSIRRGTRIGVESVFCAIVGGILGGPVGLAAGAVLGGALQNVAQSAAGDVVKMAERADEYE